MIDTSTWKEFRIGDLFDMSLSKDDIQPKSIVEGNIPLISSGKTNNGIVAYIQDDKATLQKAGTITVDMFGKAFYQSNPYYCVSHGRVNILTPKFDINEYIGLFIASTIEKVSNEKYEFDSMCTGKKLAEDIINLPVTSDGQPDWDYMESYMCRIEEKAEKNLEALRKVKTESREIDTSEWGEFKIEDLFEKPVNTGNILAREVDDGSGTTPFVTASSINNGVTAYVDASKFDIIKGDCILVGGKTFTLTYQADDFISNDSHNFVMRLKHSASNYQYEYIVSVLRSSLSHIYSWGDAVTVKKIVNDKIKLPVAPSGEPDWAYMESYMKQMEEKAEKNLTGLICAGVEFDGGKAIA